MAKPKLKDTDMFKRLPLPEGCDCCPSTGAIVMASRCHTGAPVYAILAGNILSLECAECSSIVTRLEVTCQVVMK